MKDMKLRSGRPVVGIAQTGSDLSPCNRHHLALAERVREGVRDAGALRSSFRSLVGQMDTGAILEGTQHFQCIAQTTACPATITNGYLSGGAP